METHISSQQRIAEIKADFAHWNDRIPAELVQARLDDIEGCAVADANHEWVAGFSRGRISGEEFAKAVVVTALLQLLGKDKADGLIKLGAAGWWYPGGDELAWEKKGD